MSVLSIDLFTFKEKGSGCPAENAGSCSPYFLSMIIFLICFACFVAGLFYVKRRFGNPYSLCFIFGKKGSGKSCMMIHEMLKYKKRGWTIYTDMSDCNIPGVRIITASDLAKFAPDANSALFLDEVGITFDNRNFKTFDAGMRDFFKFQRKYRCVVYMNSQAFDVDIKIRNLTDSMILQTNIANVISVSRPIKRSITLTAPSADAESRIADKLSFASIWHWKFYWMPAYFKYFNSFSAPEREPIPFTEVAADLAKLGKRSVRAAIKDESVIEQNKK